MSTAMSYLDHGELSRLLVQEKPAGVTRAGGDPGIQPYVRDDEPVPAAAASFLRRFERQEPLGETSRVLDAIGA
jgi:hypothetical protein